MKRVVINLTATAFLIGGVMHWLIIFGYMTERAPALITYYFHSLAIIDLVAAWGIYRRKRWGLDIGLIIALTQIPSHLYMMYLDYFEDYGSMVDYVSRSVDIFLSLVYLYIFKKLIGDDFFKP